MLDLETPLLLYPNQAKGLLDLIKAKTVYTHNGAWHMDDAMSVALIIKLQELTKGPSYAFGKENQLKIIRTREDIPRDTKDAIVDIYGGVFDHHGLKKNLIPIKINGVENLEPAASAGCVFDTIKHELFTDEYIDIASNLIHDLDLADLGMKENYLSKNISKMPFIWGEDTKDGFDYAVYRCTKILDALEKEIPLDRISKENLKLLEELGGHDILAKDSYSLRVIAANMTNYEFEDFVNTCIEFDKNYDILNKELEDKIINELLPEALKRGENYLLVEKATSKSLIDSPIEFCIFPLIDDKGYGISTVKSGTGEFSAPKRRFPTSLDGKIIASGTASGDIKDSFEKRGLKFVHPDGFYASAYTKEDAINFVLEISGCNKIKSSMDSLESEINEIYNGQKQSQAKNMNIAFSRA